MSTPAFAFPQSLAEKYRPRTIAEFVGLEKPKKILAKFASAPEWREVCATRTCISATSRSGTKLAERTRADLHGAFRSRSSSCGLGDQLVASSRSVPASGTSGVYGLFDGAGDGHTSPSSALMR